MIWVVLGLAGIGLFVLGVGVGQAYEQLSTRRGK